MYTMKKFLCSLAILLTVAFGLTGCVKCISTETAIVQVKVTDEYYRASYVTPTFSGKSTIIITHPAVYKITVEYDRIKYIISGRDTYNKYSNRVGEYINGTLQIKKYDDGTVRYDIVGLE